MKDLGYKLIDCDNHYYEPDDCFTRHIEPEFKDRTAWIDRSRGDGYGTMMVGSERCNFFSVGAGDFVGPPGAMKVFFKGDTETGGAVNANGMCGLEEPVFVNKTARLKKMDEQNLEACIMLPTMGVGIENQLRQPQHRDAMYPSLRAFNKWLAEDWGWGQDGRIFSVALLSLIDVDEAVKELQRVAAEGCKLVWINTGPVDGKSPADPHFDAFWARVQELDVTLVYHIGNSPFNEIYAAAWGDPANPPSHRFTAMNTFLGIGGRTVTDQVAATIFHNLFGRFPQLRFMIVEYGASWVPGLVSSLDKIWRLGDHKSRWPNGKPALPSEIFKKHFKVVPFHEDSFKALEASIGINCIISGSDYPHPEGLLWPVEMEEEMQGFNAADIRKMMRSNAADWLGLER